ncbi:MAG: pyruvate, phosphate dikinase [Bacteroidetes bacterium]|nr:MAG: pyruvate, phosphate dikinase [Bacteroidota bacterium]
MMSENSKSFEKKQKVSNKILGNDIAFINKIDEIIRRKQNEEYTFNHIIKVVKTAFSDMDTVSVLIVFGEHRIFSEGFNSSPWNLAQTIQTYDGESGYIEVFHSNKYQVSGDDAFTEEERFLLNRITQLIEKYLNERKALNKISYSDNNRINDDYSNLFEGDNLLQNFISKNYIDRKILHSLMPFKVNNILLVATLYDAYNLESEGRFFEEVLLGYEDLNLTSFPQVTGVSTAKQALKALSDNHFDLVIIMTGMEYKNSYSLGRKIKKQYQYIPVHYLLNNNTHISSIQKANERSQIYDQLFTWNGNSDIFFAMIKSVEDSANLQNDTSKGLVRVILLVEDSPKFYSRYLPLLYKVVFEQTKKVTKEINTNEFYKALRMRSRPKIILATNYEDAMYIFNRYKGFMLAMVTDMSFPRNGKEDNLAGFKLIEQVRSQIADLPIIMQSSNQGNERYADDLNVSFMDKNSETLITEFKDFIITYLGFGDFVFKNKKGHRITVAHSFKEFQEKIEQIPIESLEYHASRNHFSLWLMARGEIQVAKILNPARIKDFKDAEEIRRYILDIMKKYKRDHELGKLVPYNDKAVTDESNIVALAPGSLGGKGRGLAFINTLVYNFDFSHIIDDINIRTPSTLIIGAEEFDIFMQHNNLYAEIEKVTDYMEIRKIFLKARLSVGLHKRLLKVLRRLMNPIAVRSSGLLEDSLAQPFAGVFETYLLPNSNPDIFTRLKQLEEAIKMVFASIFSKESRDYIQAVNYKLDEERMAVVIQEIVGSRYGKYFYPHISGVAQSNNFYPLAHMKPEDGFSVIALGLGTYVVDGEKAFRFSPKHPKLKLKTPKDQYKDSQLYFYAIDLSRHSLDLLEGESAGIKKLDIYDAEIHGSLKHLASTYNMDNDILIPGIRNSGPRVLDFANILQHDYIPLAKTLVSVLEIVKEAMGTSVEIEFAVDLNKDKEGKASFYFLQIKPLLGDKTDYEIDEKSIDFEKLLLFSEKGMGNGHIDNLRDIIYVDINKFDKSKTLEMAEEIALLNDKMKAAKRKYVLIGPGRWGTRDPWIGIPVKWSAISNAKVIVETNLEDFPLDSSSGSHFFHNVISMNVGYLSVNHGIGRNRINYEQLNSLKPKHKTKFFRHIQFEKPLTIKMDGKKRIAFICPNEG